MWPKLEHAVFSDRSRKIVWPLLAVAIIFFWQDFGKLAVSGARAALPTANGVDELIGEEVFMAFGLVQEWTPEGFLLTKWNGSARVQGAVEGTENGSVVSVRGVLLPDLQVRLTEGHVHQGRDLKWVLGLVTLLWVTYLCWIELFRRSNG